MSATVIVVDLFGFCLVIIGFHLAFRQDVVRHLWRQWQGGASAPSHMLPEEDDPVRYALRISGVMIMVFGIAIAMMFTLFHLL